MHKLFLPAMPPSSTPLPDDTSPSPGGAEGIFRYTGSEPLPAATLRAAMAAGQDIEVHPASPEAEPIRVEGELDASSLTIKGRVRLHGVRFEGFVNLRDARFEKETDFSRCEFSAGISLRGARVEGSLNFEETVFESERGEVDATGLRVEGMLIYAATRFGLEEKPVSLLLNNARIGEDLFFSCARVFGDIGLSGADIAGDFYLFHTFADYPRTWIGGDLIAWGCHVGGQTLAMGIRIEGNTNFASARLDGIVNFGINPVDAEPAHLGRTTKPGVPGQAVLHLAFAVIGGTVVLSGARLEGQLNLTRAVLKGGLSCRAEGGR